MRFLIVSDIHANLEAMDAVLDTADEFDEVIFLGDVVGYGPNPNECVARLRSLPRLTALAGNHDLAAIGRARLSDFSDVAAASARWTSVQLTASAREYLESLVPMIASETLTLAHASPRDPVWEYLESPAEAAASFFHFSSSICLVGHTHVPRVFELGVRGERVNEWRPHCGDVLSLSPKQRRIINPGGVGQPRDGDPRAAFAQWDTATAHLTFHRVAYPLALTQRKIIDAGLPRVLASRLAYGR